MAGTSLAIIPPSKITAASAPTSSIAIQSTIVCPPISSSPSQAKRRLTGSAFASTSFCAAFRRMKTCPLSSVMPRAYAHSSRIVNSNGSLSQSSSGAGGWTSKCP